MEVPRLSLTASLALLQARGFSAKTFLDIGAAEGLFFLQRQQFGLFPEARHFFVDAMDENAACYKRLAAVSDAEYAITALSCMEGTVKLKIDPGFYNTHISGVQNVDYPTRAAPVTTLDSLVAARSLPGPYILKLDVQGAEMDVLRGARRTMEQSTIVVAESQIGRDRDTLADLLGFMQTCGFVLFDLTNLGYYPSTHLLYECYATFIPRAMDFRGKVENSTPALTAMGEQSLRERRQSVIEAIERLAETNHAPARTGHGEGEAGVLPRQAVH